MLHPDPSSVVMLNGLIILRLVEVVGFLDFHLRAEHEHPIERLRKQ
jgi:hypothetical protein